MLFDRQDGDDPERSHQRSPAERERAGGRRWTPLDAAVPAMSIGGCVPRRLARGRAQQGVDGAGANGCVAAARYGCCERVVPDPRVAIAALEGVQHAVPDARVVVVRRQHARTETEGARYDASPYCRTLFLSARLTVPEQDVVVLKQLLDP